MNKRNKHRTEATALLYISARQPAPPSGKEELQGVVGYKNPRKQDGSQHMSEDGSQQGGKTMTGTHFIVGKFSRRTKYEHM